MFKKTLLAVVTTAVFLRLLLMPALKIRATVLSPSPVPLLPPLAL